METKLNIAEILKDKPKGTKLYTDAFGELRIEDICTEDELGITLLEKDEDELLFYNDGKYNRNGEPILFPSKEMDDWSKFAWKKGDILVSEGMGRLHVIFEGFDDDTYTTFKGKHYLCNYDDNEDYNKEEYNDYHKELILRTIEFKKDNVNNAQTYINIIEKRLGGKLNLETLEIEKTQPEFNDGDIVFEEGNRNYCSAIGVLKKDEQGCFMFDTFLTRGKVCYNSEYIYLPTRLATEEEKKQFFSALEKEGKAFDAEKKQIIDLKPKIDELKPFDKVLVRDDKEDQWSANIFSYQVRGMFHCIGEDYWKYCIPYEGNEHLLGTTKNVEN